VERWRWPENRPAKSRYVEAVVQVFDVGSQAQSRVSFFQRSMPVDASSDSDGWIAFVGEVDAIHNGLSVLCDGVGDRVLVGRVKLRGESEPYWRSKRNPHAVDQLVADASCRV